VRVRVSIRWIRLVFGIHGLLAQACALTSYRWQVGKVEVREVVLPSTSRWQSNQTGLQFYTTDMASETRQKNYTKMRQKLRPL